ncbi:MAG: bifunctional phosphopantothenoylcysteine decarboxylase/phosphopantothenate--cysteine ligase CoaBC [Bacillota bacterium]|nr:bifunctional phosphopantothenoylcysteine decarboxylase/phosphopantothenate--cysteine ligase CoaBC [Bacillota bacterium]
MLTGKRITVGITGGIAAYKAAELVSRLRKANGTVQVVMTASACRLISSLTLKTLSGRPVAVDIMDESGEWNVPHIDCAACDLFVVVPATANFLAKAACGLADDVLSAAWLACTAPKLIAPAMHCDMYANAATAANIAILRARGCEFVEPGHGRLACGAVGQGRLADIDVIESAIIAQLLPDRPLAGKRVLVTAGPTHEYIDPVRYIANRSSGKMGYACAEAAAQAGAEVTLISGPSKLAAPVGVHKVDVVSAAQMYDAVWSAYAGCDIVIMAAAVADYRVADIAANKLKKQQGMRLELVQNADILASLGADKGGRLLIGFAAETEDTEAYARAKLRDKNLDMIVANDVSAADAGFDVDTNIITMITADSCESLPLLSKREAARAIIAKICQL